MMNIFHLSSLLLLLSGASIISKKTTSKNSDIESVTVLRTVEEDAEYIPWTSVRRLMWDDFLCEPKRNTDAVASTSTSLGIAYQVRSGELSYQITCNFSKVKSWGLLKTDYILAHEQGHFDLTEIYARKLYEAISNYKFNRRTYRQDVNAIYQQIVREKEAAQAAYDGETDHSRNRKVQYEWFEKIQQMLDETEVYSVYP